MCCSPLPWEWPPVLRRHESISLILMSTCARCNFYEQALSWATHGENYSGWHSPCPSMQTPRSRHTLCNCLQRLCFGGRSTVILGWTNLRGLARQRRRNVTWHPLYVGSKKKWYKWTYSQNRKRLTDLENKLMVAGGKGTIVWEGHPALYPAICKTDNQQRPFA